MLLPSAPFVQLPQFEGPLELLLFLIKKEEINIYDIPITLITERYLQALSQYKEMNLEVGGEFLVMAATLMYIKSRMLLPQDGMEEEGEEGADPRAQLVRQLLELQMFQEAGDQLKRRDILNVDTFHQLGKPEQEQLLVITPEEQPLAPLGLYDLIARFKKTIDRSREFVHHVSAEEVTLRKCIETIVERLNEVPSAAFTEFVADRWSLRELVVMFLAILELCKMRYIRVSQAETFGPIRLERNPETIELDWSRLSWI